MKLLRAASALVVAALVVTGCDQEPTGPTVADLAGMWNATEFRYTDANISSFSIDAISDAGGSVTLTVEESGSFSGSVTIPGLTVDPNTGETITMQVAGTLSISGDTLSVSFEANPLFTDFSAAFTLSGDVLTFTNPDTSFDFPDTLEEQAGIGARGPVDAILDVRFER